MVPPAPKEKRDYLDRCWPSADSIEARPREKPTRERIRSLLGAGLWVTRTADARDEYAIAVLAVCKGAEIAEVLRAYVRDRALLAEVGSAYELERLGWRALAEELRVMKKHRAVFIARVDAAMQTITEHNSVREFALLYGNESTCKALVQAATEVCTTVGASLPASKYLTRRELRAVAGALYLQLGNEPTQAWLASVIS